MFRWFLAGSRTQVRLALDSVPSADWSAHDSPNRASHKTSFKSTNFQKTTRAEPATSSPTPTTDMRVCYYRYRHRLRLENNRNTSINNEVNKRPTFSLRGVQLAFSPFQEHFSMQIMHRQTITEQFTESRSISLERLQSISPQSNHFENSFGPRKNRFFLDISKHLEFEYNS